MEEFRFNIEEGLLSNYLQTQFKNYAEPTRKGTPKGEPIGFSRVKFGATLLSLTSIDLKKQSKMLGVSYGLLRKWRTEEQFSEMADSQTDSFGETILNNLDARAKEIWPSIYERHPEEEEEFYEQIIDPELHEDFMDLDLYSSELLLTIYKRLSDTSVMVLNEFSIFRFYFFLYISESLIKYGSIQANQDVHYIKKNMFNRLKEMVIYHLKMRYLSDERRILLESFLNLLPGYVGI